MDHLKLQEKQVRWFPSAYSQDKVDRALVFLIMPAMCGSSAALPLHGRQYYGARLEEIDASCRGDLACLVCLWCAVSRLLL